MSDRTPDEIVFEAEYWKAALDDVLELNERVGKCADTAIAALPANVELIAASMFPASPARLLELGRAMAESDNATLDELRAMQAPIMRLVELIGGRMKALHAEAKELGE